MPTSRVSSEQSAVEILKHYQFTCAVCLHPATEVHEIVPRSKKPENLWDFNNRVPLCKKCHHRIHEEGTRIWEARLQEARETLASLVGLE